jgi:hypothetical protein
VKAGSVERPGGTCAKTAHSTINISALSGLGSDRGTPVQKFLGLGIAVPGMTEQKE